MRKSISFRLIVLYISLFFFSFSTFFNLESYAASLQGESYYDVIHASSDSALTGNKFHTINANLNTVKFSDLTDMTISNDKYYSVDLETTVAISATQAVNWRIPYCAAGDYIVLLGSNVNTSQDFFIRQLKTFTMSGEELKEALNVSFRCYVFNTDGLNVSFDGYVQIFLTDIVEVSSGTDEVYNAGYESGYRDGEDFGYNSGYGSGYQDGENAGFDAGYDEGFDEGVGSVDTDSYFEAGYEAGYESAYIEGFDEGYARGYSEALSLNTSNSSSLKEGEVKEYSFNHSYSKTLHLTDANTPRSSFIEYENIDIDSTVDCEGVYYDWSDSDEFLVNGDIWSGASMDYCTYSYNISGEKYLFQTSSDVYAYKIVVTPSRVSYSEDCLINTRLLLGSQSDIYNLDCEIGEYIANGQNRVSRFWITTDHKVESIYIAYLNHYYNLFNDSAQVNLNWDVKIEVTPYTREEFNAAAAAVEKQTLEIQKQMEDLKYGYDNSAGTEMNSKFEASLNDYQVAEDSIFTATSTALNNFSFFDFNSVPAMLTGISFVTSIMTGIFHAMGGASGAGIVLSVLFSVMLVSMVLGLYRLYQSDGKKDAGNKGPKGGGKTSTGGGKGGGK